MPKIPVASVLSAYSKLPGIKAATNRGAFDFINKTIDLNDPGIIIKKPLKK